MYENIYNCIYTHTHIHICLSKVSAFQNACRSINQLKNCKHRNRI